MDAGGRGVAAIAMSNCGNFVAMVDKSNDHNVYCFDANSGELKFKEKGDANNIFDISFTQQSGQTSFATAGQKHIKFWEVDGTGKKGIHGALGITSHACIAWDDAGNAYTGTSKPVIYVWNAGSRSATSQIEGHSGGFICSLVWREGKLYSGGKDGCVMITDTASSSQLSKVEFGVLVRAIDVSGSEMAVGLRNGNIVRCSTDGSGMRTVMESHSDGEIWGLGIHGDKVVTTADDNKIKVFDTAMRQCVATGKITDDVRRIKVGASSLSNLPASQCARACDINPSNGHIAIGCNDGYFRVRESIENIDNEIYSDRNSRQWIEAIQYSPDGSKCAVGSHDNQIRIYDANNGYSLLATCSAH